jgi:hypothetical protein
MTQYFKRERGGVNPVGWTQPFILRDPPKAIFTRKYEPVNVADTMYMYRADNEYGDPTRYNEAIQVYARGQNPMVEVSYQNAGGASTNSSLGNSQVSNPYKVEVVRPPITPLEALQPISAPRMHQNYSVTSNPAIYPQSVAGEYDKSQVRLMTSQYTTPASHVRANLNASLQLATERYANKIGKDLNELLKGSVATTHTYHIDNMRENTSKYVTQTKDVLPIATTSNITFTDVVVFDPKSNSNVQVETKIKDKHTIAVTAAVGQPLEFYTNDGQLIRLKDYDYKVVTAPYGNTQMVITVRQPDVVLNRNTPLYSAQAASSNSQFETNAQRAIADLINLESVLPLASATSSIKLFGDNEQSLRSSYDPSKYQLELNGPLVSATSSINLSGGQGYNEEIARAGKHKELDKQSTFGSWMDRTTRPNTLIRGMV